MEQPLLLQSGQFLWSVALGAALGIVYDLLRGLRRNLRGLTHLLDFVFSLTVLLSGLLLALFVGGGQYRLFMPLGTALGAAIYFLTLSRPVARLSCAFWRLITYPLRISGRYFKKICKKFRKTSFQSGKNRIK